jgi:hypothetical protein
MRYPEKVPFNQLETYHPDVLAKKYIYETADDLLAGGNQIRENLEKYLCKKPDEDAEVYKYRKKIFTYTPILGQCLAQLMNRMTASNHVINGLGTQGDEGKFWAKFRESVNGNNQKEKNFIKEVFYRLLKYERVYAVIDIEYTENLPKNRKEQDEQGLMPYIALYDPCKVVHYDEKDGRLQWIKIRELMTEYDPVGIPRVYLNWTFIDDKEINIYSCPVELAKDGTPSPVLGFDLETKEYMVSKKSTIEHGRDSIPVVKIQAPENLWVVKEAIYLVLEHIRVHNNLSYTANLAGQIQRLFTPMAETVDKMVDIEEAKQQTGNHRVLIGSGFSFNETTGSAISTITGYLQGIESRIKDLVFSNGISAGTDRPMQESGVAKSMDFISQEQALTAYGEELLRFLENCYKLVALAHGLPPDKAEMISVSGLNEFVLDSVDAKVDRLARLEKLETPIADTAMRLVTEDLQRALTPNASIDEQNTIQNETKESFKPEEHFELSMEELSSLVLNQIVSVKTAQELLGFDPEAEWENISEQMRNMQEIQAEAEPEPEAEGEGEGETVAVDLDMQIQEVASALSMATDATVVEVLDGVGYVEGGDNLQGILDTLMAELSQKLEIPLEEVKSMVSGME